MPRKNEAFDIELILGLLSKSSLPTVIVEGEDDIVVYRRMEELYADVNLSVLPVGGRNNVLSIFERLNEIQERKHIAFIADLDTWVLSNIPQKYISDRLIFTDGYSIENDIFKDGELDKILLKGELVEFNSDIAKFSQWYALAISRANSGHDAAILRSFPSDILDKPEIFQSLTTLREQEVYPKEIHDIIISDYAKFIRGKSLMQILSRQLSHKSRRIRVQTGTFLVTVPAKPGPLLNRIFSRVENIFCRKAAST